MEGPRCTTCATYKQTRTNLIMIKIKYKQRHFHDFSIITTEKKRGLRFDHAEPLPTETLMKTANCTPSKIKKTYEIYHQGPPDRAHQRE
eukprot:4201585-Amphidinium_carterae.2